MSNTEAFVRLAGHFLWGNGETYSATDPRWIQFIKRQELVKRLALQAVNAGIQDALREYAANRENFVGGFGRAISTQIAPTTPLMMILNMGYLDIHAGWHIDEESKTMYLTVGYRYRDEIVAKPSLFQGPLFGPGRWPGGGYKTFPEDNLIAMYIAAMNARDSKTNPLLFFVNPQQYTFETHEWQERFTLPLGQLLKSPWEKEP